MIVAATIATRKRTNPKRASKGKSRTVAAMARV
jgi:hypothetical protein